MRFELTVLALYLAAGCAANDAGAQPAPETQAPPAQQQQQRASPPAAAGALPADASIDAVLDALDRRGEGLTDFSADVTLTESDDVTQLSSTRTGRVAYQKRGDGGARLRVTFDTKKTEKGETKERIEYLLEDGWLWDRDYRKQIQVRRQVLKPGEKIDLLKLGEGPFPLPLGQDKEEVHKLFDVKQVAAAKEDPPNTIHLQLIPKPGTDFERKFGSIDFWVDRGESMPVLIETRDAGDGNSVRVTELRNVKLNTGLNDQVFALDPIDPEKWQLTEEAYSER